MAQTETIVWVALPNGASLDTDGRTTARLSVFVSPRLRGAARLGDFPDFLEWPRRLLDDELSFSVAVDGGPVLPARLAGPPPDLALWQALFSAETPVASHKFDDYADRPIISYPVQEVLGFIKQVYRELAASSPDDLPRIRPSREDEHQVSLMRSLERLIELQTAQARELNEERLSAMLEAQVEAGRAEARRRRYAGQRAGPLIQPSSGFAAGDARHSFNQVMLFHYRPAAAVPAALPEGEAETSARYADVFDFHRMLAALSDHPELLRRLGLVIDLEFDGDLLPRAAEAAPGKLRLVPAWTPSGQPPAPEQLTPATFYNFAGLGGKLLFAAASRSQEHVAGIWAPPPGAVELVQVDVDGAALKTLNTAATLARQVFYPENLPLDSPERDGVAALRTGGISLVLSGRARRINDRFNRSFDINQLGEGGGQVELYAEDLLHGYRLDVYDETVDDWFSLHQRSGHFNPLQYADGPFDLPGEGFVQPSIAEPPRTPGDAPDPGGELYIHESLFTWDGWSLSAPRPGKSLGRSPRAPDPADPETQPHYTENKALSGLPLEITYRVRPGSLPRLRFGRAYNLRVRTVDLAGTGPDPEEADQILRDLPGLFPAGFPPTSPLVYVRFEPVAAPELAPRLEFGEGESLERLVVRSSFDTSAEAYAALHPPGELSAGHPGYWAANERHVVPPKAAQAAVETHGMLDAAFDARRQELPAEQYQALVREAYDLSAREAGSLLDPQDGMRFVQTGGTPEAPQGYAIHSAESLSLPYLPDPWSQGAVFYGLPGTPAGEPFFVFWDAPVWHAALPFRFRLEEGSGPPAWDPDTRLLTVRTEKSAVAEVRVSSLFGGDLKAMGLWQWLEEAVLQGQLNPDRLDELGRMVQEGRHWMFTPFRKLALVHAVQQPLAEPSTEQFEFRRSRGATKLHLHAVLDLHSPSTAHLDLAARWQEAVDDLAEPGPQTKPAQAHVLQIPASFDGLPGRLAEPEMRRVLQLDADGKRFEFDTETEEVVQRLQSLLAAPAISPDERRRLQDLLSLAAQLKPHEFGDTKYRRVSYRFSVTSRFREYFSPAITRDPQSLTRWGEEIQVEVLSSAPPAAPRLLYVMPTYGWEQAVAPDGTLTSTRRGGGLRVYLDRQWLSSGEGELLGIVVSRQVPDRWTGLDADFRPATIYPYDTYWGDDPLWRVEKITLPNAADFLNATAVGKGIRLAERPAEVVTVYGHAVAYDDARKLWYCDLELSTGARYAPFIRLALVRYQPNSLVDGLEGQLGNVHVSSVITAEIVQTAPDRTLTVSRGDGELQLALAGPAPSGRRNPQPPGFEIGGTNQVEAVLERRLVEVGDETLGWEALGAPLALPSTLEPGGLALWNGTLVIPPEAAGERLRLVVREFEPFTAFATAGLRRAHPQTWRPVYVDIVEL